MKIFTDLARRRLGMFELALIVLAFCVVALALVEQARKIAAEAERTAMQMTVSSLRLSLKAEAMLRQLRGEEEGVSELVASNPMALVDPPVNYQGELTAAQLPGEPGHWYFDLDNAELVYRARYPRYFQGVGPRGDLGAVRIAAPDNATLPKLEVSKPWQWQGVK